MANLNIINFVKAFAKQAFSRGRTKFCKVFVARMNRDF